MLVALTHLFNFVLTAFIAIWLIEQMHRARRKADAILSGMTDCFFELDRDFRFTAVNERAEAFFGAQCAELTGQKPVRGFVPARGNGCPFTNANFAAPSTRSNRVISKPSPCLKGHALGRGACASRARSGLTVFFRDATGRKSLEEQLRASEAEFRAMFELSGMGRALLDAETAHFLRVNVKLCEMTGYSADELLRMTAMELTCIPADLPHTRAQGFERLLKGEEYPSIQPIEKRLVRKDALAGLGASVRHTHPCMQRPARRASRSSWRIFPGANSLK